MSKKEIVPKDSKYVPLTQQRYCCVPTCIQMVMLRHNIALQPAELIGYHLGLVLPKKELKYFWNGRTGKRPPAGYGTQVGAKYSPNAVFRKLKIPLKMSWMLIDKFKDIVDFRKYLEDIEKKDKDIIVCYNWGKLFNKLKQGNHGHVCVLDKVFIKQDEVRIIDPEYYSPKWKIVKIKKLYEAMVFHGKQKSGGFWELNLNK
jgi:hypothetical protein